MTTEKEWQIRLQEAVSWQLQGRIFAAFNTNVDVVVHVTENDILNIVANNPELTADAIHRRAQEPIDSVSTPLDLLAVLKSRMVQGKSHYIKAEGSEILAWLDRQQFSDAVRSMGGQAGIIANQMASLGAKAVVYTPLLSPAQAALFSEGVVAPVVSETDLRLVPAPAAARPHVQTKINWIFEYPKDMEVRFGDEVVVTPRANRVILATRPKDAVMMFSDELRPHLESLGASFRVAFMAGYHYAVPGELGDLGVDHYLEQSVRDLRTLKAGNPDLRLHFEYVPMKESGLETKMLREITGEVHSFGINEHEIKKVLQEFAFDAELSAIENDESAVTLYRGARSLLRLFGLNRLQVHNLGYYVILLNKPQDAAPRRVLNGALYASAVNAMKAKYGGYVTPSRLDEAAQMPLSDIGFTQLTRFEREVGPTGGNIEEGIWEFADHYALVVPAHVVSNPVSTVGMGDTVSSSAYAMETCGAKVVLPR